MEAVSTLKFVGARSFTLAEADFANVVSDNERMVFSIARNMLGEPALAEEVAQDVFLELFRHRAEIESEDHLVFWLRRVTSNRCIDAIRRRRPTMNLEDAPEPSEPAKMRDPLAVRAIREGILALPAIQRAAITLRYQEELELNEIASTLGVPLSTVKSHLHRGLKKLRKQLETLPRRLT